MHQFLETFYVIYSSKINRDDIFLNFYRTSKDNTTYTTISCPTTFLYECRHVNDYKTVACKQQRTNIVSPPRHNRMIGRRALYTLEICENT